MRCLFAVYDVKSETYGPVMAYGHEAVAVRDLQTAMQDPQSQLARYPEDFVLVQLGELRDPGEMNLPGGEPETCPIRPHAPRVIVACRSLVAPREPQLVKEA